MFVNRDRRMKYLNEVLTCEKPGIAQGILIGGSGDSHLCIQ